MGSLRVGESPGRSATSVRSEDSASPFFKNVNRVVIIADGSTTRFLTNVIELLKLSYDACRMRFSRGRDLGVAGIHVEGLGLVRAGHGGADAAHDLPCREHKPEPVGAPGAS